MTRISKTNFWGLIFTALAIIASSAILGACAPARGTSNPPIGSIQGASNPYYPINGTTGTGTSSTAQMNAILGTYAGTIHVYDSDSNEVDQPYTITVTRVSGVANQPGGIGYQVAFTSGNQRLQSLVRVDTVPSNRMYGNTTLILTSSPQSAPAIYEYGSVLIQLQLEVNSSNQFDSNSISSYPVGSFPWIGTVSGYSAQAVVDFNSDFSKVQ